jgi:uncharacterized membrane protein YozB (DUF420 family)
LAGAMLARRKRYRAHARCQSIVVLLNLAAISLTMVPSFGRSFAAATPARLMKSYYALAAVHATLGTVAELLALYILLAAGTNVLPVRLHFTRYRAWMRAALVSWWATILFGLATYVRWYVTPMFH